MSWLRILSAGLSSIFHRQRDQRELDEELRGFLDMASEEKIKNGLTQSEARRSIHLDFGNIDFAKEAVWSARWESHLDSFLRDLRFSLRMLRKNPGFTAIVILTLGLGIGANTAIFSVVHTVLLKALPYPEADRLVMVYENVHLPNYQNSRNLVSPGNFADWIAQNSAFQSMAAYRNRSFNLTGMGEPLRVEGELASAGFFETLQTRAALGRVFTPEEDRPGNSHVVVLSDALWKDHFGSDPRVLGQKILLDGEAYEIVGIMPPGFHFPDPGDQLWAPLALTDSDLHNHGSHFLAVFARLKPDVSLVQAQSGMNLIAHRLTQLYPDSNADQTVNTIPLREDIAGPVRPALLVLLGAVALVLLIVCANISNLLLARASVRHREIAMRLALGAGRARLARQLLTETAVMAMFGGALGLLLAHWGVKLIKLFGATNLPRTEEFTLSLPVLLFSLAISVAAGLLFGVAPLLQSLRGNLQGTLKSGSRESAAPSRSRTRSLLVVLETALSFIVVISAGLLVRSFLRIEQIQLGFQPQGVVSFRVIPRGEKYSQASQRTAFYQHAAERLRALPGVQSVAAVSFIPLTLAKASKGFTIENRPPSSPGQLPMAGYNMVTPEYFRTMHIAVLQGRDFSWSDSPQSEPVAIINEAMAKRYWPAELALGKRFHEGSPDDKLPWMTIVGVVTDVREFSPTVEPAPTMYLPVAQFPRPGTSDDPLRAPILRDWVIRTTTDTTALVASNLRSAIWQVDKDLPVTRIRTMEEVRSVSLASHRLNLLLFAIFAALALALATLGTYGVLAYSVAQRTSEIGIRLALGASRKTVLSLVIKEGMRLAAFGIALGLVAAIALTRLMAGMIYGISSTDPLTFFSVAALLAVVAIAACYLPARNAMRIDPINALRYD
jgi:putative ABC transport system permease protein